MSPIAIARPGHAIASALLAVALVGCDATAPSPTPSEASGASPAAIATPTTGPTAAAASSTPEPTYPTAPQSTAPWTSFPRLLQARVDHTATALRDGRILVVGGSVLSWDADDNVTSRTLASVEIFQPESGTWVAGPDLHDAREDHHAVLLADGRVLVFGGRFDTSPTAWKYVTSAELFDPATETWEVVPGPPTNDIIVRQPIVLVDGSVFMLGAFGTYPEDRVRPVFFDPATDTWRRGSRAPEIRIYPSIATLSDESMLVAGGAFDVPDGEASGDTSAWRYDISGDAWHRVASLPHETFLATALVEASGDILLVGDGAPERYDPTANRWTQLAEPHTYRNAAGVVELRDGRVLAAGSNSCSEGSEAAEIFDPVANTWIDAGSVAPGNGDTLVLLPDGRAVMVGGYWECQAYDTHETFGNVSVLDPSTVH